jgi:hypothetical protein
VFENRVVRRIFLDSRAEIIGGWSKLHNVEPHNLYSSPNINRMMNSIMRWAGNVARVGEKRNIRIQGSGGKARSKETTRKT